jgi:transposase
MMLKVLVFGHCIGIRSSRKLDCLLERDVTFRYLAANQHPDFRTISLFRENHHEEFEHLFVEILRLCREAGMAEMGRSRLGRDGRPRRRCTRPESHS